MPSELHLDFETRSACDLKKAGLYVYAEHPTTEIILISWAFDAEEVQSKFFWEAYFEILKAHVAAGGKVVAQNAAFERIIWNAILHKRHGWPKMEVEQCRCTMAQSYAMAIPGSLEKAAPALGIDQEKDMKGQRVMMKLSKPKKGLPGGSVVWHEEPHLLAILKDYGKQDVVVERLVDKRQLKLSPDEQRLWCLDQKINDRGIKIDIISAHNAIALVEKEKERLNLRMREVTKGAVSTCTATGQLTDWLHWNKINTEGVAKSDVVELLNDPGLPPDIREALLLRQEANKSSTAKLAAMVNSANSDGRVRGTMQFHGAGTGRWAGRKLQVHNFPRGKYNERDTCHIFDLINSGNGAEYLELFYDSPLRVISDVLRSFIIAELQHRLIWGDWNSIEARILAWLAGEESVLDIFRRGEDVYKYAASKIFGVHYSLVTKDQRQIGKVAVLALGYQGGKGAFQAMAKGYGVKMSDKEADTIKANWRNGHPNIVKYWHWVERQAILAVRNPGTKFSAGPKSREINYLVKGSFLFCQLPSKRLLTYPYPKIQQVETPWGEMRAAISCMGENSLSRKWERQLLYGGLLVENITQAVARDILARSLGELDRRSYPIIFHVHDEVVCEVPNNMGSTSEVEEIMCQVPDWAKGLPIAAEVTQGKRYRK